MPKDKRSDIEKVLYRLGGGKSGKGIGTTAAETYTDFEKQGRELQNARYLQEQQEAGKTKRVGMREEGKIERTKKQQEGKTERQQKKLTKADEKSIAKAKIAQEGWAIRIGEETTGKEVSPATLKAIAETGDENAGKNVDKYLKKENKPLPTEEEVRAEKRRLLKEYNNWLQTKKGYEAVAASEFIQEMFVKENKTLDFYADEERIGKERKIERKLLEQKYTPESIKTYLATGDIEDLYKKKKKGELTEKEDKALGFYKTELNSIYKQIETQLLTPKDPGYKELMGRAKFIKKKMKDDFGIVLEPEKEAEKLELPEGEVDIPLKKPDRPYSALDVIRPPKKSSDPLGIR